MENNIRKILMEKNIRITEIIKKTGLSRSYFYDIMKGVSIPSLIVARKIASAIGVRVDELFPDKNSIEKEVN